MTRHPIVSSFLASAALIVASCGTTSSLASSQDQNDESISIGYGSTNKSAQAFASSEAIIDDSERDIFKDIYDYLRTKVPGVSVSESDTGTPKILVRGQKDLWGNDPDPLFVLDGQIIPDPSIIQPNQVYSVEVLKDAAASAYGSRSANGVIMFKTVFAHEKEVQEEEMRRAEKEARKAARKK